MTRGFQIRHLGEIAIRCEDIAKMMAFYGELLGLERMFGGHREGIVFYRIGDGFEGHTQILALFDKSMSGRPGLHPTGANEVQTGARSSLHHLALNVPFPEQEAAMLWFDDHAIAYRVEVFDWIGWRGVFVTDPEGNTVELVAYHDSLKN
ncbi:MAG: VOC family protein [Pseudomonadota bacterium]